MRRGGNRYEVEGVFKGPGREWVARRTSVAALMGLRQGDELSAATLLLESEVAHSATTGTLAIQT